MRCKNCGWDNPEGNVICEKCNAPISDYSNERTPQYNYEAEERYHPRATVVNAAPDDFNPRATAIGCVVCGYPARPGESECPSCGHTVEGDNKEPGGEKQTKKTSSPIGTIIQGAGHAKEKTDTERKKLTGFLVTYSHSSNGDFFPLYEGKNMIGRADASQVCVKNDSAVSEKHLSILYRAVDRKFKFKDEQSSNGTFINDELIDEGELKNLDVIRIGTTQLQFIEIPQHHLVDTQ